MLSIALPTIGRDLGSGTTALQWVTGAYSLTFGGLLLTAGSMADRLGRRRVLLVGLAVFGSPSLCVVAVSTAGELIAPRAALGIAAAAMAPITNSLVFRLFDDKALRMRAITVMMVVGMSGFVLGPLLGGTALAHVRWEWLLVVNAPIALVACLGVRLGVPARGPDPGCARPARRRPQHRARLLLADQRRRARLALRDHPRLPHRRCRSRCRVRAARASQRGAHAGSGALLQRHRPRATIAQIGTSIAMASVMFGLILHFQYAYGWTPVRAGLANLPIIVTMIVATPFSEWLARRFGHRIACLVGAAFPAGSLAGLSWGVEHGYAAIAFCMVLMTAGLRTVMTICAVALVDAMPSNRTSVGTALNDAAQEVGTSVGTAVVGTLIAALVTTQLPAGTWSNALVASFFHGEQITYARLAVVVGLVTAGGAHALTDSHATEEPA